MINIQTKQIRSQFDALDLDVSARECGVDTGWTKKIRGQDLLHGFLLMHAQKGASLEQWAGCIESFTGDPVSKQAVHQRCTEKHAQFFERVCRKAIQRPLDREAEAVGPALRSFGRVIVEDSTCVGLGRCLAEAFPSSYTKGKPAATARLQLRVDLKQEQTVGLDLGSYRDNDQSYSREILKVVDPGDLVVRDLGYFSLPTLQALGDQGSLFLSRLRYGVAISDPTTGDRLNMTKKNGVLKGKKTLDRTVTIGVKTPVTVRLVGQRVPKKVAAERRRKAKNDRHAHANHSTDYLRWLDWNFFVTNVGQKQWTVEEAVAVYRLRWRIEMVFKALKSCFQAAGQLEERQMSVPRVQMTIYGWLLYSVLIVEPTYRYFAVQMARRGKALSLLKYSQWLQMHYVEVLMSPLLAEFIERVEKHGVYDTRHDRRNYHQQRRSIGANNGPQ